MTSGVYQLTFPSGRKYIGKSINIEQRWKQHYDKMVRGKASAAMQREWNTYRDWKSEILVECHEDHIDVVEACFIARNRPELNTTRPRDPYPDKSVTQLSTLFDSFKYSASDHATTIDHLAGQVTECKAKIMHLEQEVEELEDLNDDLLKIRREEEIEHDVSGTIKTLDQEVIKLTHDKYLLHKDKAKLNNDIQELNKQLAYAKLPWWKKLFS
jgi:hypothetical protein